MSPDVPANWSNWSNSSNLLMASVQCLPFPFLTFLTFLTFHAEAAGFGRIGRIRLSTSAFKLTAGHGTRHHASSARYGRSVTQRHAPYQGPSKQGTVATSGGSFAYLKIFYTHTHIYILLYYYIYIARSARVKVLMIKTGKSQVKLMDPTFICTQRWSLNLGSQTSTFTREK